MMARLIHYNDEEVVTLDYGASKVTNVLVQEASTKGYLVWAFRFRNTIHPRHSATALPDSHSGGSKPRPHMNQHDGPQLGNEKGLVRLMGGFHLAGEEWHSRCV